MKTMLSALLLVWSTAIYANDNVETHQRMTQHAVDCFFTFEKMQETSASLLDELEALESESGTSLISTLSEGKANAKEALHGFENIELMTLKSRHLNHIVTKAKFRLVAVMQQNISTLQGNPDLLTKVQKLKADLDRLSLNEQGS